MLSPESILELRQICKDNLFNTEGCFDWEFMNWGNMKLGKLEQLKVVVSVDLETGCLSINRSIVDESGTESEIPTHLLVRADKSAIELTSDILPRLFSVKGIIQSMIYGL